MKYVDPDGRFPDAIWDAVWIAWDGASFLYNTVVGNGQEAAKDAACFTADGVALFIPGMPAVSGPARAGAKLAPKVAETTPKLAKAVNKFRQAVMRGIQSEKRVLQDMGLTKNTKKIASKTNSGKPINVIPDAIQDGVMYEVKDTKAVYNTSQIQGEYNAAKEAGYEYKIVTGEKTHVSSEVQSKAEIIRRSDLGPQ